MLSVMVYYGWVYYGGSIVRLECVRVLWCTMVGLLYGWSVLECYGVLWWGVLYGWRMLE